MLSCFPTTRLRPAMGWLWLSLFALPVAGAAQAQMSADDALDALQFQLTQRAYPNNSVDPGAYARAIQQRERLAPAHLGPAGGLHALSVSTNLSGSNQWAFIGPNNLMANDNTYNGPSALSGRVNAAAFDPADSTGNTIYVGAATGGVWKTTNGGTTWSPLSDGWQALQVSSIAIDPSNHNTVYAGTGDFQNAGVYSFGLMKSTDGGNNWTNLGAAQFGSFAVSQIAIDPENSQILTVATGRGAGGAGYVWRSTDGGASWSVAFNKTAQWSDVCYSAYNSSTSGRWLYASGLSNGGDVWRSGDYGATWTQLTTPMSTYFQKGVDIATSPTNPAVVYLMSGADKRIWKSTNAGNSWTPINNNFSDDWRPAYRAWRLQCSTRTVSGSPVDVVYVGIMDLKQSSDGGNSWHSIGGPANSPTALIHIDQHCVVVNPNNANDLLIGNDGGVYRLAYSDSTGACTYTSLNTRLGIGQSNKAAFHLSDPNYMLSGMQGNSTAFAFDNLLSWQTQNTGDGGYCLINPTNSNIQFISYPYLGFRRTDDLWVSQYDFTPTTNGQHTAYIAPIVMDPNNPNTIYAATSYLYRWNDTTWAWTPNLGGKRLAMAVNGAQGVVLCIAVAPTNSSVIYTGSDDGEVWMTTNGGAAWTQINTGNPGLPNRSVTSIAVSPTNANAIVVGLSGAGAAHVWACNNTTAGAARTWVNLGGSGSSALPDIPVNAIALDPSSPDSTYYAGTDIGVFQTADGGNTWSNATAPLGLPNVQINDLKAMGGTNYLYAATCGRGIWRISLSASMQVNSVTASPSALKGGQSATGTVFMSQTAPAGGTVVSLSDNSGATSVPSSITVPAGATSQTFTISTNAVANDTTVTITATYNGKSKQTALTVQAPVPALLSLNPNSLTGGASSTGTVTLDSPAPSGGLVVALTSDNSAAKVPSTVTVPAGAKSAQFTVTTNTVTVNQEATITASYNGVSQKAYIVIHHP